MATLTIPGGYDIIAERDGFAIIELYAGGFGRKVIERDFPCEIGAIFRAQEIAEDLAAEAYEAALAAAEYGAFDVRRAA